MSRLASRRIPPRRTSTAVGEFALVLAAGLFLLALVLIAVRWPDLFAHGLGDLLGFHWRMPS